MIATLRAALGLARPAFFTLLDQSSHAGELCRWSTALLAQEKADLATLFADRRCRIAAVVEPIHYLLRAQCLWRNNEHAAGVLDIRRALELDPCDLQVNRLLLKSAEETQETERAARELIARETDAGVLAAALKVLSAVGWRGVGVARVVDHHIKGWAAWNGPETRQVQLRAADDVWTIELRAQPQHALSQAFGRAASFTLPIAGECGVWAGLARHDGPLELTRSPIFDRRAVSTHSTVEMNGTQADATVIVPVFDDFLATKECLESLLSALAAGRAVAEVIVVDDASPDPRISELISGLPVKVLTNETNLGFVGSVNKALAVARGRDVLLLNSDTILPPGFLDRLRAASLSAPDIGTVTPLSNNGELTSLPEPFVVNETPSAGKVRAIDAWAASANAGALIDLPSGTGFCLYITRRCLDTVGPLSEAFERGYCEDSYFCLLAREKGLRNVCTPSVFVGHHGSRSFKSSKRALVVANLRRLEARFPRHRLETGSFMALDPLRGARWAIGRRRTASRPSRLIVAGRNSIAQARARATELSRAGHTGMVLARSGHQAKLETTGEDGRLQEWTGFDLRNGCSELVEHLGRQPLDRIEVMDPLAIRSDWLRATGRPIDVNIIDGSSLFARCGHHLLSWREAVHAATDETQRLAIQSLAEARGEWLSLAAVREQAILSEPAVSMFLETTCPEMLAARVSPAREPVARAIAAPSQGPLGIVPLAASAHAELMVRLIAREVMLRSATSSIVVLGDTSNDLGLMKLGNVFVTGKLTDGELSVAARRHAVSRLVALNDMPVFAHPMFIAASALSIPLAYYNWSYAPAERNSERNSGDLPIDPTRPSPVVAAAIAEWCWRDCALAG